MEGTDPREKLRGTYLEALKKNWMVWPGVQAVNFKFVPLEHRVLVVNVVSLGEWGFLFNLCLNAFYLGGVGVGEKGVGEGRDEKSWKIVKRTEESNGMYNNGKSIANIPLPLNRMELLPQLRKQPRWEREDRRRVRERGMNELRSWMRAVVVVVMFRGWCTIDTPFFRKLQYIHRFPFAFFLSLLEKPRRGESV